MAFTSCVKILSQLCLILWRCMFSRSTWYISSAKDIKLISDSSGNAHICRASQGTFLRPAVPFSIRTSSSTLSHMAATSYPLSLPYGLHKQQFSAVHLP
jgi:hypothetical protein